MDKKVKVRYRKKEEKYIVEYSRVKDVKAERFLILQQINASHDMFVVLDTELLGTAEMNSDRDKLPLGSRDGQNSIISLFVNKDIPNSMRHKYVDKQKKMFGVPMGKSEKKEEVNLAFYFDKGTIDYDVFEQLLCYYDYMIGIESLIPIEELLDRFNQGELTSVQGSNLFKYELIDSLYMQHFYTDYNLNK